MEVEGAVDGFAKVGAEVEIDSRLDGKGKGGGTTIAGVWGWRVGGSATETGERKGDEGADSYRLDVGDTDSECD